MEKRILFDNTEDLTVFADSESETDYYAMSKEMLEKAKRITRKFGGKEKNVPKKYKVNACPMIFLKEEDAKTDVYVPSLTNLIDFPINRIEPIIAEQRIGFNKRDT